MKEMPFGKYKGVPISQVPDDYLDWMLDRSRDLISMIELEQKVRAESSEAKMSWIEKIISVGYRTLAKQNHPDFGGSTQSMQELNAAVEKLKRQANV